MKKILLVLFVSIFVVGCLFCSVSADKNLFFDEVGMVDDTEAEELSDLLQAVSDKYNVDVAISVVFDFDGYSFPEYAAAEFFEEKDLGRGDDHDGIMLYISMEERDYALITSGKCQDGLSDNMLDEVEDAFLYYLSYDDYYGGFKAFALACDDVLEIAKKNGFVIPKEPFGAVKAVFISLAVGFVVAFIVTSVMKSKLKTVRKQDKAANYVTPGSLDITESNTIFLYNNITRIPRAQNNRPSGSFTSSSGRSYGGRSGKF